MTVRIALASLAATSLLTAAIADACTRTVYFGKKTRSSRVARWTGSCRTWTPTSGCTRAGSERAGGARRSPSWKSRYGSVVTTIYEGAAADGMNENGLVANLLYLPESQYDPAETAGDTRPTLPNSAWVQYARTPTTTAEAVDGLRKGRVHASSRSRRRPASLARYLYRSLRRLGRLGDLRAPRRQARHPPRQAVPGDDQLPTFDQQLSLNNYWMQVGGLTMLPGTNRAPPTASSASYYINEAKAVRRSARGGGHGLQRDAQRHVPIGIKIPGRPTSPTRFG